VLICGLINSVVRKLLIRIAIVVPILVAMAALWIFDGRKLSLFLDRFGTIAMVSTPVGSISYEGDGKGGTLHVNDLDLSLNGPNPLGASPEVGTTKDGQVALSFRGKVFAFGPARSSENQTLAAGRPTPDMASISTRRNPISWPTPFEVNFMTGHSPSWKRYLYYHLTWKKPNGATLDMLWRYQQYFYPSDGWANGFLTDENTTGLIHVEISNAGR